MLGWGGWVLGTRHNYEDRPGPNGASKVQVTERGLPYLNRWPYGVGARVGIRRLGPGGPLPSLRHVRRARPGSSYPELPRLTLGLELGWL